MVVSVLGSTANKAINYAPSAPDAAKLRRLLQRLAPMKPCFITLAAIAILVQFTVLAYAADEGSAESWPKHVKQSAIAGCRQAIMTNAKRDYLQRNGLTEADLPSDFEARFAPAIEPVLAICDCMFGILENEWSVEYFLSHQYDVEAKTSEIIESGRCKVEGGT